MPQEFEKPGGRHWGSFLSEEQGLGGWAKLVTFEGKFELWHERGRMDHQAIEKKHGSFPFKCFLEFMSGWNLVYTVRLIHKG